MTTPNSEHRTQNFEISTILPIFAPTSREGTLKSPLFCFWNMSNREKIVALIAPKLEELGCFLVDVKINPSVNKYEIFIDNMEGVTIEACMKVSRYLESQIDLDDSFPQQYSLDVSSPGMENPFKVPQQYAKNIGKTVELVLNSGIKKEGILKEADAEKLRLEVHIPPPKKGMKPKIEEAVFAMEEIKSTKKKITF